MKLVADNLHIINPVIQKALETLDPRPIQEIVARCEKAGADAIDINTGPLFRNPEKTMTFMVETVQSVSNLPILIDTANPKAMEAGLQANKNSSIINGFSLEPQKLEKILPLAKKYKSDIIGYLLYPDSRVPSNASERCNLAIQILQAIQNNGIDEHHLIIDPVIVPLSWQNGNQQAKEILIFFHTLPDLFGFQVKTIAGLSNLTSGLISGHGNMKKKLLIERTYLPMLASAGLDMALFNIFHNQTVEVARACKPLISPRIFSWAEL
ncbi:MAG: dihydropteroate synthase [Desulfobacterium sp.]|nr:dihydropteroate synthase [Desulfobacterium sp.]